MSKLRTKKKNGALPHADIAQLDALRFVWSMPEWRWQCVLQSLVAYKKLHGDLQVPKAFVVPSEAPWPKDAWGVKLGHRVHNIRSRGDFVKDEPERRAELDALGFVWDDLERRWEEMRDALAVYKELHGDLQVTRAFVVPAEAPWPKEAWGMKLGKRVNGIRAKEHYVKDEPERRAELDALGFVWDDLERRWEETRDTLAVYKEVHGDLQVTRAFVVPSEAPWPKEAWGMKLGSRVNDIRAQEHYVKDEPERRAELDAMGFRW